MFRWILLAVLVGTTFSNQPPSQPLAQTDTTQADILTPRPGETVSGSIQITGSAFGAAFRQYQLHWAPDPPIGDPWQPIQAAVTQQVRGGILGVWDTTAVPDGFYLIRLRVVKNDNSVVVAQVQVKVVNATPTSPPTARPTATHTPIPGTPTPGPSPTALIQQPPTRTPRPPAPGGPTVTPTPALADSPFRRDRLQQAACNGVWITVITFFSLGLYGFLRTTFRGHLRVGWWRFQREIINPLLNRGKRRR